MKKILLSLIFLAVVLLSVPAAVGFMVKRNVLALLHQNTLWGNGQLKVVSYQQGWFHSTAELLVTVSNPEWQLLLNRHPEAEPFSHTSQQTTLWVEQTLTHGPVVFAPHEKNKFYFGLGVVRSMVYSATPKGVAASSQSFASALSRVNYHGVYESEIYVKPFSMQFTELGDTFQLGLPELRMHVLFDPVAKHMVLQGHYSNLFIKDPHYTWELMVPDIFFTSEGMTGPDNVWIGHGALTIPKVVTHEYGLPLVTMRDIHLSSRNQLSAQGLLLMMNLNISGLEVLGQSYAPIRYQARFAGLNVKAFKQLEAVVSEEQLLAVVPHLLDNHSRLSIETLTVQTPYGLVDFQGESTWPQLKQGAHLQDSQNLLRFMHYKANIRVPVQLVDVIIKMLPVDTEPPMTASAEVASHVNDDFAKHLTLLEQQKKISAIAQHQLFIAQQDNVSMQAFATQLKSLVKRKQMRVETSHALILLYAQAQAARPPSGMQTVLSYQSLQQLIKRWLQIGFIKQEAGAYHTEITGQGMDVRLNGYPLQ